jgi:hypothetical protein
MKQPAIPDGLTFFDLAEFQLDWRGTAKNNHFHT